MRLHIQTNRLFSSIREFSFIKQIGVGSFGSVKLALHIETNKCYAVKIVQIGCINQNQLMILERQINLHSAVDHPHIIKLWDTLLEEQKVYMIMELAQNGTLFTFQNKHQSISQSEVFKFFSQTLNAVKYLHENDIMHRDIKPQNILLDHAYNVKICDLGWATDHIQVKRKTFCGTYEYMAPEMVFEKEYNYSIDIWALGILLYELLHGFAPFPAKSLDEMKQKIKLGYYQLGTTINKELKNLIVEILQFEADQRPSIKKILAHPWIQKLKRDIKNELGKIQNQIKQQSSTRAKVQKDKPSLLNSKKHKRYDSLLNQNLKKVNSPEPQINNFNTAAVVERVLGQEELKKKGKKKCKTQGEESMEKIFNDTMKNYGNMDKKFRKQKENGPLKFQATELCKTSIGFKGESNIQNNFKMRKIAQKLSQLTNKYPGDKKKNRLKTQKDEKCQ